MKTNNHSADLNGKLKGPPKTAHTFISETEGGYVAYSCSAEINSTKQ